MFSQPGAGSPSKTGTLQTRSVTASQLATDSPAKMNGHYHENTSMFLYFNFIHCINIYSFIIHI